MHARHRAALTAVATCCLGAAAAQADASDTQQRNLNPRQRIQSVENRQSRRIVRKKHNLRHD